MCHGSDRFGLLALRPRAEAFRWLARSPGRNIQVARGVIRASRVIYCRRLAFYATGALADVSGAGPPQEQRDVVLGRRGGLRQHLKYACLSCCTLASIRNMPVCFDVHVLSAREDDGQPCKY